MFHAGPIHFHHVLAGLSTIEPIISSDAGNCVSLQCWQAQVRRGPSVACWGRMSPAVSTTYTGSTCVKIN